jgi:hypothetical protein
MKTRSPSPPNFDGTALDRMTRWTSSMIFTIIALGISLPVAFTWLVKWLYRLSTRNGIFGRAVLSPPPNELWSALALGSLSVIALGGFMAYTYQVTSLGRTLLRPAFLTPTVAALAWLIPLINLCWPYRSLRVLTRNESTLRVIDGFWFSFLASFVVITLTSFFLPNRTSLWLVVGFNTIVLALVAALGREMMWRINDELYEHAAAVLPPPTMIPVGAP